MHFFNLFLQNRIMLLVLFLPFLFASLVAAETIYLDQPREIKGHSLPACTALTKKESRGRVNLRDVNKSWSKFRLQSKDFNELVVFTDFAECIASVETYKGRYNEAHLANFQLGNLTPGMPSEFALMLLGPNSDSNIESSTDQQKTITSLIWSKKKKRNLLGTAINVAGAVTGATAVVAIANQASTIATTAEAIKSGQETGDILGSAITIAGATTGMTEVADIAKEATTSDSKEENEPYSINSLKSAQIVTIQVDERNIIQTLSSE
mgnify:FL=1